MCSNPQWAKLPDGTSTQIACRVCNDCIATRKSDWVARCVAETVSQKWCGVISLTYDGSAGSADGATAFRYKDVQDWLKRVREKLAEKKGERPVFRYIVAGENGSMKGRVHWHVVLWADSPAWQVGTWADFQAMWNAGFAPSDGVREGFECEPENRRRLVWSEWPFGHVFLDEGNIDGIRYALKYALAAQFGAEKAKGTDRFTKSSNTAAGYFRMSKKPPIGQAYIDMQLQRWCAKGGVPTKLELRVPGLPGFWYPSGLLRERLLEGLHLINERVKREEGRDAPQWESLLHGFLALEKEKEFEVLAYGTEGEKQEFDSEKWRKSLASAESARAKRLAAQETRSRCGGPKVCAECFAGFGQEERDRLRAAQRYWQTAADHAGYGDWNAWFSQNVKGNPYCARAGEADWKNAFGA